MNGGLERLVIAIPVAIILLAFLSACNPSASSCEKAIRNTSVALPQHSPAQTASVPKVLEDEIPSFDESHMVAHKKRYSNYEYAYVAALPQGLVGLSDPAPMPQHGIGIVLSKEPKSYVWVDGSYNSAFWESLDAMIDKHLEWLAEDGAEIEVLRRERTRLDKLSATRLVARYKSLATGEIRVQDLVVAFRPYEDDERGITYTIGLIAPESRYREDEAVWKRIVHGWKIKPLPRA